ncbi:MAG: GGDEF domain-containing protein [Actinomycetes bacterium]
MTWPTWWRRLVGVDEPRLMGWMMSGAFLVSALLGALYLFSHQAIRPGPPEHLYVAVLACSLLAGVVLAVRPRIGRIDALVWVLVADALYTIIGFVVQDTVRFSNPMMLLLATVVAGWLLPLPVLGLHVVAVFVINWFVLPPTASEPYLHSIQVLRQTGMLAGVGLGIFLLRHRSDELLARMRQLSTTDQLTGLPNRRHLQAQMPTLWSHTRRDGDLLTAIVLDLDRFKQINDEHGHAAGDRVLQAVAGAVRRSLRGHDVVARFGGEEIVVLGQVPGAQEAFVIAERIRSEVAALPGPVPITASVGVATLRPGDADPVDATWRLINTADAAMYQAKRQGRNRCVLAEGSPSV